jgi:hypothetical protein
MVRRSVAFSGGLSPADPLELRLTVLLRREGLRVRAGVPVAAG